MQTKFLNENIYVKSYASVGSFLEKKSRYGSYLDLIIEDPIANRKTWEEAESAFQKTAFTLALKKASLNNENIDCIFAGDLINQCMASSYAFKEIGIPFCGVYGACSTMALTIISAANLIASKMAENAAAVTSSHFCSAERQYRFPLEYGGQRTPSSQWTATASGCTLLTKNETDIFLSAYNIGKIVDLGVKDSANMGAAMAPAAADTIMSFLHDSNTAPSDYDASFTGDLGEIFSNLLYGLLNKENIDINANHHDCGLLLYNKEIMDVHSGASGCGCSAAILNGYIFKEMQRGTFKNILFCATGALLSETSSKQSETIPAIAHLINFRRK